MADAAGLCAAPVTAAPGDVPRTAAEGAAAALGDIPRATAAPPGDVPRTAADDDAALGDKPRYTEHADGRIDVLPLAL